MRKKLLSMVVIFCMVFILGACGSKEAGSEANGNTEDEKAKIKIEELNYQVNVEVDNGEVTLTRVEVSEDEINQ